VVKHVICPAYTKTAWSNFSKFLCMLPVAVARSSSNGVAICHVFPVLQISSYFHTMGPKVAGKTYKFASAKTAHTNVMSDN